MYLEQVPIGNVWGIGEQTTAYLTRFGMATALDFARQDELWVRSKLTKPHQDIWHELRGTAVIPLEPGEHHAYQSISKTKTFTPPTSDRDMLLAQLSKNVENACNVLQRITGILDVLSQLGENHIPIARWRGEGFDLLDRVIRLMFTGDQRKDRGAVQLLPDLIKRLREILLDPGLGLSRELQRGLHAIEADQAPPGHLA